MASAVGRTIAIDKATQDKTRPSTARVKVILDLMDKHRKRMHLQYMDKQTGTIKRKNQDNNHKDDGVVGKEQFIGEKFQAMVEAIKNDGYQVVDSSVRDDTPNTTITLNCTLATVSYTSVVPVINFEYDQASNPKLPTAGVLSGKDPSLAMIEDPGQANKVQRRGENLDRIFESGGTCDHDFALNDNDKRGWTVVPSKKNSQGSTKLQQLDCTRQ
ncbi:hypothetical protein KY289_001785 [Solanum tuberosum]|nr:hypothetical protein KY289_001785 [Solanum tuberosum]